MARASGGERLLPHHEFHGHLQAEAPCDLCEDLAGPPFPLLTVCLPGASQCLWPVLSSQPPTPQGPQSRDQHLLWEPLSPGPHVTVHSHLGGRLRCYPM